MVLPRLLPSPSRRRPDLLTGAIMLCLLFAGTTLPAAADGGPAVPATAAPRSRLHVEIPGYTAYYVPDAATRPRSPTMPGDAAAPLRVSASPSPDRPSAVATGTGATASEADWAAAAVTKDPPEEPGSPATARGPLLAAAQASVNDATLGLVLGYTPGSVGVTTAAEPQLHALAERMRQDPTMIIALEGFAGGGDALRARRLAMWRARAVRTRLIEDGVDTRRIRVRAAEAGGGATSERVDVRIVQP